MSSASGVPETFHLSGDDARETLKRTGRARLLKDSVTRFRTADGFTNSRAFGHALTLTIFPGMIMVIGMAAAFNVPEFRSVLHTTVERLAPGPTSRVLDQLFRQGSGTSGWTALWSGLLGFLVSGTFTMAMIERGADRIYGMTRDRTLWKKLAIGLALNVSAGVLLALGFVVVAFGGALGEGLSTALGWGDTMATVFSVLRWPVGIILAFVALTLIYKISPNRRQPGAAWMLTGTIVATALWSALTALLAWYYSVNDNLGSTYGPLVGVIALLTWAYATGLAVFFGVAFAAQLEAVRAGVPGPRTHRRFNEAVVDPDRTAELSAPPGADRVPVTPATATPPAPAAGAERRTA